jgi:adenylate cyclase
VAKLSANELAELVPCAPEEVHRLIELGILAPDEDDRTLPPSDVHVVRLMAAFDRAGINVEDVARGVRGGHLSFPLALFMPEPAAMSTTYGQLAAELGRPPELLRRLSSEFGVAPPADDRVRVEDAEVLALVVKTLDLATDDDLSRFARLYGGTVQRLVGAGLQFFDRAVRQPMEASLRDGANDRVVYEKGAAFTELVTRLVPWLQRRHRERSVLEYLVGLTEGFMEERGIAPRQSKQEPAIAFLDLSGYTALADERGDDAAAEVAAGLATVVQGATARHGGRPVKWLGDGVMMHFNDPGRAILSGLELVEEMDEAISAPARIGINAGTVVVQEGDYFGRTVNVAARIADYARPREVLVSEAARDGADIGEVDFELIGDVALKGVSRTVRLHKATRS